MYVIEVVNIKDEAAGKIRLSIITGLKRKSIGSVGKKEGSRFGSKDILEARLGKNSIFCHVDQVYLF